MIRLTFLLAITLASTSHAQGLPACPDSGADPKKFCAVGMQWSDETQSCVVMA